MARLPYVDPETFSGDDDLLETSMDDEALPEEYRDRFSTGSRHVHRAIANNPAMLRGFRDSNSTVWQESGLGGRERELAILASARASDSRYEWHQHVRHGLSVGLTPQEIRAVARGEYDEFSAKEAALVAYAAAVSEGAVDDETFERFADRYDRETVVGTTMLVGSYAGLARSLDAMGVEPEEAFVGWELEDL